MTSQRDLTQCQAYDRHDPLGARLALLIYWPALMICTHWQGLHVQLQAHGLGEWYLTKPFYVLALGILQGLLFWSLPLGRAGQFRLNLIASVWVAAAYAYCSEYAQILFDQPFSTTNLLCSMIGICIAMWLMAARVRDHQTERCDNVLLARLIFILFLPMGLLMALMPSLSFDVPIGLPMGPTFADRVEMRGDHLLHLFAAFSAVWLFAAMRLLGRSRPKMGIALAIVLQIAAAPILELVQQKIGRGFEWSDLIAHEIGVLLALLTGIGYLLAIAHTPKVSKKTSPPEVPPASPPASPKNAPLQAPVSFVRHARTVGGLTLLSRMTGLVRDAVLAATLGLGHLADAFHMGFLIPHLFRRLFGEGALSAAFIPKYSQLRKTDPVAAQRLAWACISLLLVGLGMVVLIGEGILLAVQHYGTWSDTTVTAIKLMMLMLPYMPLICAVALLGGVLQVHHHFGPPAAAPILLNLAIISAASLALWQYTPEQGVYFIGLAVLVAGAGQLAWQWIAAARQQPFTRNFQGTGPNLWAVAKTMLPMLIGLAVFQLNAAMDSIISYSLSPKEGETVLAVIAGKELLYPIEPGAVAALNWSQRLYQFPLGVFGIAIATAIFPALAHAAAGHRKHFATILHHGLRLTVFVGLPASVGLILVRLPLTRLIYQYGRFDLQDAQRVSTILIGYAIAIWAYSMTHVLTRAFYALDDVRTPLKITVTNVFLNLTLNCIMIWYMGVAGLAWSTALCAIWGAFLLIRAMRRHLALPLDDKVLWSWGRSILLTLIMTLALLPILNRYDMADLSRIHSAILLAVLVMVGMVVYLFSAWLFKAPEWRWLLGRHQNSQNDTMD